MNPRSRPAAWPRGRIDLRLALPAAACWLSAGVLVGLPGIAVPATCLFGLLSLGLIVWALVAGRRGSRRPASARIGTRTPRRIRPLLGVLAVCSATMALPALSVAVQTPVRYPDAVRAVATAHGEATGLFTVWSAPVPTGGPVMGGARQLRFRASLVALEESPDQRAADRAASTGALSVPVVVFAVQTEPAPAIGDVVRLTGTFRPTDAGDAAAALFFGRSPPELVRPAPWWLAWAGSLRQGFADAATQLPGKGAGLLPGLAIGDTRAVSDELDSAMKTSSLSHLTAVSGANCAVVLALVLLCGSALRLGRGWRMAAGLAVLAGFVVLVTPEPSVMRAATMATIVVLSGALGRPGRGLPALALACLCLLVADPWLARNYGFALSVLATFGLLVVAGPLSRRLRRWMPTPMAAVLSIPIAAQLACQPVLIMLSPTLPAYGVPANLLAAPAAPVATMAGLVACLILPWAPAVGTAALWAAWLPATWIAAVAETTAGLPGSSLPWVAGPLGVILTVACTLAVLVLVLGRARGKPTRLLRAASAVLVCCVAGWAVGVLIGTALGRSAVFPADWQIAACDIGQGDAVLVRDGDLVALVDVGPDPAPLSECLDTLGIDRVDLLVLTHYDLDHVGGLAAVVGRVGTALVGVPENGDDSALHARLAAGGAEVREAARGDRGTLGRLNWQILWPVRDSGLMQVGNPGSVTILFEGGGLRSAFLGDLNEEAQDALLAAGPIGRVDVVKVAHHGSRDQSAALYAQLGASVALVSVGVDNGYGHPTQALLDILAGTGTTVLRTDQEGMAVVAPGTDEPAPVARLDSRRGGPLVVWTEKVAGAG